MLDKLFIGVLNMSLIGSYAIVFVLVARLLIKKTPKIFSYALWGIVLFRLLCPFSFESVLSLMPMAKTPIPQDIIYSTAPQINTGISAFDGVVNPILPVPSNIGDSVNPIQIWLFIGAVIWVIGMATMVIYCVVAFIKLKKSLIGAAPLKANIYLADHISSPFVMGLFKPKIYLPSSLSDNEKDFIIAHEMCHVRRFDHVTRILGFATLTIHWFNPLVWIAFIISGRDMEMSCDEAVMKKMDTDIRTEYSQSLLRFGTAKRMINATPLAFGEGNTKSRVKNVLNYKKPMLWVIVISMASIVAVGVGLMSNPVSNSILNPYAQEYIPGQGNIRGDVDIESYEKISSDFAIGADKYGVAVFKAPHKAFDTFVQLYAEGIAYIQKANDLPSLSQDYYNAYKKYGMQMTSGTKEQLSQAAFVSRFLDIYENSFVKQPPLTDYVEPTVEYAGSSELSDRRPMVMVDGTLYLDTGKDEPSNDIVWEGTILSTVEQTEKPTENGQSNFGFVGKRYRLDDKGLILETNEMGIGIRFEKEVTLSSDFPIPEFGTKISETVSLEKGYEAVSLRNVTREQAESYIKVLQDNGWTAVDDFNQETTVGGHYKKGIHAVSVQFAGDLLTIYFSETELSPDATASAEYTMMKLGKNGKVLSSYSLKSKELADAILFDVLSKSAAWEGVDVSTLEECYLIRQSFTEIGEIHDYYAYRSADGTSVLQGGTDGRYSTLSSDLYLQLVDSFKSNDYLFFWLKPDEPPQYIGDTAANVWLKSFMNEQTPAESRISDYVITDVTVIAGEPKKGAKWEDMAYQYVVQVTYNITTATEQYLTAADGISGKGSFQGLFRELCVKVNVGDGGGFQIVDVGTGGGEHEFLRE